MWYCVGVSTTRLDNLALVVLRQSESNEGLTLPNLFMVAN